MAGKKGRSGRRKGSLSWSKNPTASTPANPAKEPSATVKAASGALIGAATAAADCIARGGSKEQAVPQRVLRKGVMMTPAPPPARALALRRRTLYLAISAGGAKMKPAQIAEAQQMAREWVPKK